MGVNTKAIKRRIKSVGNTKKITKAMEMISAVKMRKAVANVLATRGYANLAWAMLVDVAKKTNAALHPILTKRPIKKMAVIFITSNRGLSGGFTSRLLQETHDYIIEEKKKTGTETDIILLGKRGRKIFSYFKHPISAEFEKIDITTKMEEILPMARMIIAEYMNGKYDKVAVAYTDFVSAIKQIPRVKQILPLEKEDELLGKIGEDKEEKKYNFEFKFEPKPAEVLSMLLPRLVEMQIYQTILESDASEHSARMMAMRNASDAAEDMIKELNYNFNKARQAGITQEISEIVGGVAALG
ncbi:MAG: ATP synthase F1 subunit gamma [Patescibacteria group bacterium]|jgi:F-type H+-transporting ATPase subunit gamma